MVTISNGHSAYVEHLKWWRDIDSMLTQPNSPLYAEFASVLLSIWTKPQTIVKCSEFWMIFWRSYLT